MYRSIETLSTNNIKVFSIKTDALTIKHDDLDLAQQLLDFEPGLGSAPQGGQPSDFHRNLWETRDIQRQVKICSQQNR